MATADFKINTSVQADRGYDATNGEAITLTLENAPAIDVYKVVYSVVTASDGAPAITFSPGSGQPTTPTGNVTFTTTGSGFHSYLIQCQVNDGKRQTDRGLVVDAGYTKQRMIVIRGALTNLRKTVPAETTQYGSDGWSVALNELADAVENGSVGGISTAEPIVTYGPAPTIPNAVDLTAITTTVDVVGDACEPISLTYKAAAAGGGVVEGLRVKHQINAGDPGTGGEGVRVALSIPDNAGVDTIGATWRTESTSILLSVNSKAVWATVNAGALTDWMTLGSTGILSVVTGLQSPSLDTIAAGALTLGGTNATSIAASGLKITGLADGAAASDAAAFGQIAAALAAPLTITLDDAGAATVPTIATFVHTYNAGAGSNNIGAQIALSAENSVASTVREAAYISGRLTTATDGAEVSEVGLWTRTGGGALAKNFYGGGTGIWTTTGAMRSDAGFDRASAGALTLGGTVATSIEEDSTTGVVALKKGGVVACTETWEPTGASTIVPVAGSTSFTIEQAQLGGTGATAGNTTTLAAQKGQNVAAGPNNAGGNLVLASGDHGSGGVDGQAGSVLIKIGTANAINCAGDGSTTSFGATVVDGATFQASSKFTGPQLDRANAGALTLGGTNATSIAGSGLPFTGVLSIDNNGAAQTVGATTTSLTLASTGTIERKLAASQIDRVSFGVAGVNYIDLMPKVLTTNNATATNAITLAMVDHSAAIWEVWGYCYIVGTETSRAYFHWHAGFNRAGGAPTRDYHFAAAENGGADVVVGAWGSPPTLAIVAGAPGANDASAQVTGVLATDVKWTLWARIYITTTSA